MWRSKGKIGCYYHLIGGLGAKGRLSTNLTALKANVATLMVEVIELKSTIITSLWGSVEVPPNTTMGTTPGAEVDIEHVMSSPDANKERLGTNMLLKEHAKLMETEEAIIVAANSGFTLGQIDDKAEWVL